MWGRCFSILLIILGLFKPPGHQKAGVTLAQQQGKNPLKTAHCSVSYSTCLSAVPCCDLSVSALAGPEQPYSDCPHPCCVPAACPRQKYHIHLQVILRLRLPPLNSGWSSSSLTSFALNSSGLWNIDYSPNLFSHTVLLFSSLYPLCQKPGTYLENNMEVIYPTLYHCLLKTHVICTISSFTSSGYTQCQVSLESEFYYRTSKFCNSVPP